MKIPRNLCLDAAWMANKNIEDDLIEAVDEYDEQQGRKYFSRFANVKNSKFLNHAMS